MWDWFLRESLRTYAWTRPMHSVPRMYRINWAARPRRTFYLRASGYPPKLCKAHTIPQNTVLAIWLHHRTAVLVVTSQHHLLKENFGTLVIYHLSWRNDLELETKIFHNKVLPSKTFFSVAVPRFRSQFCRFPGFIHKGSVERLASVVFFWPFFSLTPVTSCNCIAGSTTTSRSGSLIQITFLNTRTYIHLLSILPLWSPVICSMNFRILPTSLPQSITQTHSTPVCI